MHRGAPHLKAPHNLPHLQNHFPQLVQVGYQLEVALGDPASEGVLGAPQWGSAASSQGKWSP